jgi:hypothetical protein
MTGFEIKRRLVSTLPELHDHLECPVHGQINVGMNLLRGDLMHCHQCGQFMILVPNDGVIEGEFRELPRGLIEGPK